MLLQDIDVSSLEDADSLDIDVSSLEDSKVPVSAAPEVSFLKELKHSAKDYFAPTVDTLRGIPEGITTVATGMTSFIAGNLIGLGEVANELLLTGKITPKGLAAAKAEQEKVMEAFTFQGESRFGKTIAQVTSSPFEAAHKGIEYVLKGQSKDEIESAKFLFDISLLAVPNLSKGAYNKLRTNKRIQKTLMENAKKKEGTDIVTEKPGKINLDDLYPKENGAKVKELIKERSININKARLDESKFVIELKNELTKQERDAVPLLIEGIKDKDVLKKLKREDLQPIVDNPSPQLQKTVKKVKTYFEEAIDFFKEEGNLDVPTLENYVTHIYRNLPKEKSNEFVTGFITKSPFVKKRTVADFETAAQRGFDPILDITEILSIYSECKLTSVYNRRYAEGLKKLKDADGSPLIMRADKAPADWPSLDHPALNRAMATGKTKKGDVILSKIPCRVHPDIVNELNIVFGGRHHGAYISAFETVNAYIKKSQLSLSLFHHFALSEAAVSTGIGLKSLKLWNPVKIHKALKKGDYEIYKNMPLAKDAITHGVTFGALSDVHRGIVEQGLQAMEYRTRNIKGVKHITKGFRKFNQIWDATLWDHYHNTLKLWAYEENIGVSIKAAQKRSLKEKGRNLNAKEIKTIKDTMGEHTNNTFGGQNWDLTPIMSNPKIRQGMHAILLAPDWTISVLKQAFDPVKGVAQMRKEGAKSVAGRALAKRGAMFWAKALVAFNLVVQSANYHNTKKVFGEGKFTWENDDGHELNVFIGMNDDGTKRYGRVGKQFREVLEWGIDPMKKMGAKLNPVLRESMRQFAKHDPGSGFPTEFAEDTFWKSIPDRVISAVSLPIPFSLRSYIKDTPKNFLFAIPTSKGLTPYKTMHAFKNELKKGLNKDVTPEKLERIKDNLLKIKVSALENSLHAEDLFKSAKALVKSEITYEEIDIARKIFEELRLLDAPGKKAALIYYKQKGILTPDIEARLKKCVIKHMEMKKLQKKAGVTITP